MGYCQLFGVTPFAVKSKKLRLLIEEMKRLFDAQAFSYQKKTYAISHSGIAEALDLCVKKDFQRHLENHNYLKRVMVTIAEREGKMQSRQAEKDLRAREDQCRAGSPSMPRNDRIAPVAPVGIAPRAIRPETIGTTAETFPAVDAGHDDHPSGVPLKCRDCSPNNPSSITEEQRQRNLARVGDIIKTITG
jgi:hypothetical protein